MEIRRVKEASALKIGETASPEGLQREGQAREFLASAGYKGDLFIPLAGDCSLRKYYRLSHGLLMDAPLEENATIPFENIAGLLNEAGLSVPEIYAVDHTHGFMWIEDFGDLTFRKAFETGKPEKVLYEEATKSLAHLHKAYPKNRVNITPYDIKLFLLKLSEFLDWVDLPMSDQEKTEFKELWTEAYLTQPNVPQSLMLRDVLVDNLFWLPERNGYLRCGFIDFQDATWGPVTYDLVSLLEDARWDISPEFAQDMVDIYFQEFPELNQEDFWASYYLWGAQRSTRILGVFYRLMRRDGKPQYLQHAPRLWRYLEHDLHHPQLKHLQTWYKKVRL